VVQTVLGVNGRASFLRDDKGNIFFDLDPYYFKKIVEYLYLVKIHWENDPTLEEEDEDYQKKLPELLLPKLNDVDEQHVFGLYIDFFRLRGDVNAKGEDTSNLYTPTYASRNQNIEANIMYDDIYDTFLMEKQQITVFENKVDEMEKRVAMEENFYSFFTQVDGNEVVEDVNDTVIEDGNKNDVEYHDIDDVISFTSMTSDLDSDMSSSNHHDNQSNRGKVYPTPDDSITVNSKFLNLWIGGEIIPVTRSTMSICKQSRLAQNLNNVDWLKRHSFTSENGTKVILIEHPASIFKVIINQLRLRSMMTNGEEIPMIQMKNNQDTMLLDRIVSNLFKGHKEFVLGEMSTFESDIIQSKKEGDQIVAWLKEANRSDVPQLAYRASRDGWGVSAFHSKCDDKGPTLTVIKTSEGYVFGGYSHHSWTGSGSYKQSFLPFLFSLKCCAGLPPTKMKLKRGQNHQYATFCHSCYGPTFGSGNDLRVGSNIKDLTSGYTILNHSYDIPPGETSTFLTGKDGVGNKFQVAEIEVFKV
jgi:hypothetical protein